MTGSDRFLTGFSGRRYQTLLMTGVLLVVLSVALFTAIRGIDFGKHVDEHFLIDSLSASVQSGTLLPSYYYYPAIYYDLGVLGMVPYAVNFLLQNQISYDQLTRSPELVAVIKDDFARAIQSQDFKLYLRIIFAVVSLLSVLWVFWLVLAWQRAWVEAVLAAALLAASWEINYHSRFLAPDAIMMQFGVLTMMFLVFAHKAESPSRAVLFRRAAAVAAALVCGSKYQGGIFLLPVLLSAVLSSRPNALRALPWRELLILVLVFSATFLVTTPGALLQPLEFARYVRFQLYHYAGGHGAHTVNAGFEHFHLILGYLAFAALSKYPAISLFFALLALVGIYAMIRESPRLAVVFLCVPALYILLMSMQRVMFIRNLLLLFPFLAILTARGGFYLRQRVLECFHAPARSLVRVAVPAVFAMLWVVNAAWLVYAADVIVNPPRINQIERAARYIDERPSVRFFISKQVAEALEAFDQKKRPNTTRVLDEGVQAVFYAGELADELAKTNQRIPINRFSFFTFLPPETDGVNPNYFDLYPRRIVILGLDQLKALDVTLP